MRTREWCWLAWKGEGRKGEVEDMVGAFNGMSYSLNHNVNEAFIEGHRSAAAQRYVNVSQRRQRVVKSLTKTANSCEIPQL